ncbi:MAG: glycosyltransferase family 4 protein [Candidatus Aenigmarchaeota archaeon]|nr:glycosyltransferase family 4 protein [Candidatus Aenigmarchaeota archaeon]
MKIAILGTKGIPGHHGVEVVVDSLAPYLLKFGHEVTVYGYQSYTKSDDNLNGIQIKTIFGSNRKNLEMISHMYLSALDTRRQNYDIIHIHSTDPCLLACLPKSRYGIIATSHGQAYLRKKWIGLPKAMSMIAERFFIYTPKIVTSVSKPLADYYIQKYNRSVIYIPNGIKMRKKAEQNVLKKWGISAKKYIFCSAGRIEKTKGLHTLIEAYEKLNLDLPLIIAGGGTGTDPEYYQMLKRTKPDNVKFVGFLYRKELFSLYEHAKIFVFPSEYEAMSMALLEGLSCGTPTIYSNLPENAIVAKDIAYSFKVSNSESLVQQIKHVLDNYTQAINLGKKAKDKIEKKHDWAKIASMYNDLYLKMGMRSRANAFGHYSYKYFRNGDKLDLKHDA